MKNGIALVGYMGSGKSYWAKKMALHYGLTAVDLDEQLVSKELNMSISNFIGRFGELAFRKKERAVLHELAHGETEMVLATGGGTPCYYDNMDILNRYFITVYLSCSVSELFERLKDEKIERPLISHLQDDELKEFIAKHLFERRAFYAKAELHINAAGLNEKKLIELIDDYRNEHT